MANVLFKQGLQSSLDQIRANLTATEGTFYLTTDSHRLYIGRITGNGQTATACDAVPVNEGVTYVNSLNELPPITTAEDRRLHAGQFYYVGGTSNILCVYSGSADGTNGGWVQINPNTDTKVDGFEYSVSVTNNVATITGTVGVTTPDSNVHGNSFSDTHTITGAGSVAITANGTDGITITGDEYSLSSSVTNGTATLTLADAQNSSKNSSVDIVSGSNVTLDENAQGKLRINATDTVIETLAIGNGNGTAGNTTGFHVKADETNGNTITNTKTGSIDPVIAVGDDTTLAANQVHYVNGTATLPVYSKADVDARIANLNAMTFKGVVSSSSAPPTTGVQVGDTYKAANGFEFLNDGVATTVSKGDVLIATGTETDGVITSGLKWEVIPAGDDTDDIFRYNGVAVTHGLSLNETMGSDNLGSAGKITLAEGALIDLEDTVSGTNNENNEITISHATHAAPTTSSAGTITQNELTTQTVTAITGIGVDAYGHIDSYATTTWNLIDTNGRLTAANTDISANANNTSATITNGTYASTVSGTGLGYVTASHSVNSSSLNISATAATINPTTHVQTTPASLTIDLVWGSF